MLTPVQCLCIVSVPPAERRCVGGLFGDVLGEHQILRAHRVLGLADESLGGVVLRARVGVQRAVVDPVRDRPSRACSVGANAALDLAFRRRRRRLQRRRRRRPALRPASAARPAAPVSGFGGSACGSASRPRLGAAGRGRARRVARRLCGQRHRRRRLDLGRLDVARRRRRHLERRRVGRRLRRARGVQAGSSSTAARHAARQHGAHASSRSVASARSCVAAMS